MGKVAFSSTNFRHVKGLDKGGWGGGGGGAKTSLANSIM